ncbi:DUF4434 domain-containing protein [Listeria booriae]|uniref:DUF4434 domain-containing protein n=1 Tax=Listeria booriae TaxID=1552123 RepID=A0A7X1D9Z8_9LIST|nr:DUF4434 domain-containing protein [Listeria booriae]MBC2178208.1 DUF4434 domain-containing protein [Listeria booriae]MBC2178265.1 DUF4434 domain-containing protein [Listeria booriae]
MMIPKIANAQSLPQVSGMFIRNDLVASPEEAKEKQRQVWGLAQYQSISENLAKAGMTVLIPQIAVSYTDASKQTFYYPTKRFQSTDQASASERAQLGYALQSAKENDLGVYLPLQLSEASWFQALYDHFESKESQNFLKQSATFSIQIADEMMQQYGTTYSSQIQGFYLPFEVDNSNLYEGQALERFIEEYLQPVTTHLRKLLPKGRIITSPLIYTNLVKPSENDLSKWNTMWRNVFFRTEVDTLMPQDGAGWESATADQLGDWYKPMAEMITKSNADRKMQGRSTNIELWNNPESYSMTGSNTMDIGRLEKNMQAVDPYVKRQISFSAHSLMPMSEEYLAGQDNNAAYYSAYVESQRIGYVPTKLVKKPTVTYEVKDKNNVVFHVTRVGEETGYVIYRTINGKRIKLKEINAEKAQDTFTITDAQVLPNSSVSYEVMALDAYGNRSLPYTCAVDLPPTIADGISDFTKDIDVVNASALSTGLPVQTLTFAEQSEGFEYENEEVVATRLTKHRPYIPWTDQRDDYTVQEQIYTDADGFAHLRLDLGKTKTIQAIGMSFVQDRNASIRIPAAVHYEVDGKTFATANQPSVPQIDFTKTVAGDNTYQAGEYWYWGFPKATIKGQVVDIKIQLEYDVFLFMRELLVL